MAETTKIKYQQPQAAIDRLFLPKDIEDPVLYEALRFAAKCFIGAVLVTGVMSGIFWLMEIRSGVLTSGIFCLSMIVPILLLHFGHHWLARAFFMISSNTVLVAGSLQMGPRSYFWMMLIVNIPGTSFITTSKEIWLRRIAVQSSVVCMLVILVAEIFGLSPPVIDPQAPWVRYFAMYNVLYGSMVLLNGFLGNEKEVRLYKQRLLDQSKNMLAQTRMSSLGEMASSFSTEIDFPLNTIVNRLENLESTMDGTTIPAKELFDNFGTIKQEVGRIAKMISTLRGFARNADDDPFQEVLVKSIFDDSLNFSRESLRLQKIELKLTGDNDLTFDCKQTQICQVLVSLIGDAQAALLSVQNPWIELSSAISSLNGESQLNLVVAFNGLKTDLSSLNLSMGQTILRGHHGSLSVDQNQLWPRYVICLPIRQTDGSKLAPDEHLHFRGEAA